MNKKLFLLLLILVSSFSVGKAQQPFKRELAIGFGGGANLSSIGFVPKVEQGMILGMHAGVTMRWITENHLGLTLELNYAQQGWKEDLPLINPEVEGSERYEYNRTINYLEMPFMTHIYFGSKRVRFIINIGPKIGYAIGESTTQNLNGAEPNRNNAQHDLPIEKKLDWGICGGPGIEFRTGIGSFLLEGRYYFALGNIYNSRHADPFSKSNAQVISAKLSYLFDLWK